MSDFRAECKAPGHAFERRLSAGAGGACPARVTGVRSNASGAMSPADTATEVPMTRHDPTREDAAARGSRLVAPERIARASSRPRQLRLRCPRSGRHRFLCAVTIAPLLRDRLSGRTAPGARFPILRPAFHAAAVIAGHSGCRTPSSVAARDRLSASRPDPSCLLVHVPPPRACADHARRRRGAVGGSGRYVLRPFRSRPRWPGPCPPRTGAAFRGGVGRGRPTAGSVPAPPHQQ